MKTFIKPMALLALGGALMAGGLVSQAQAQDGQRASAYTSANNANYYINGAYAYETAPAYAAPVPAQRREGYESYGYAPRSFGTPVRPDGNRATEQRHLDGTE